MENTDRFLREIAHRVLKTRLTVSPPTAAAVAEAMQNSCGDLYRILETVMGPAGLHALIRRAVEIAARDYPWLATVKTGTAADCPISGLPEAAARAGVEDATEGYAALLATIVRLLTTFIGEDLMSRFVRNAWPDVSFSKLSEGFGGMRKNRKRRSTS